VEIAGPLAVRLWPARRLVTPVAALPEHSLNF
jgi:hypothetical protein